MIVKLTREYQIIDCNYCGCAFALSKDFIGNLRESGAKFYCPSTLGHSMYFPKERELLPEPIVKTVVRTETVTKTEGVTEHSHRFGRGKKPQCKICGLYQHMLKPTT